MLFKSIIIIIIILLIYFFYFFENVQKCSPNTLYLLKKEQKFLDRNASQITMYVRVFLIIVWK